MRERQKDAVTAIDTLVEMGLDRERMKPHKDGWILVQADDGYVYCYSSPRMQSLYRAVERKTNGESV